MAETNSTIFATKYEILKKLGQGGFATVYLAKDTTLGRKVAIKMLDAQLPAHDPTFLKRFEREAQTVAQLNHPHIIIDVYEFGQEEGRYFIVMPYLPGPDLAHLIAQQGALEVAQVIRLTEQVGAALDYAHSQGVIHRDVKPPNVIFDEQGQAILTDFGIVKLANETTILTQTGGVIGTPYYMAPEQWTTGQMDARTDLYALGVIVYQMLTGQVPFPGQTPHRIMYAHLNEAPPPLHVLNPALSPAVEKVLLKMLAKSPAQRYQTAGQFCTDLQVALTGRIDEGKVKEETDKKSFPLPKAVWWGGVALLIILIGAGWFLFAGGQDGSTGNPVSVPAIETIQVELDDQPLGDDFQKVTCGESHRLEIKLLDAGRARIEPGSFAYTWRFEPGDSINEDSLNSYLLTAHPKTL
jgi:serine/threonine protein kinase